MSKERELVDMMIALSENGTGMELFKAIDKGVNYMSFDRTEFVFDLKTAPIEVQDMFTRISLMWLKKLYNKKQSGWFDGRNEYSCEIGTEMYFLLRDIVEAQFEGQFETLDEGDFSLGHVLRRSKTDPEILIPKESMVINGADNMHRTLQQTFSACVFAWLFSLETEDALFSEVPKKLQAKYDSNFSRTPFI